MTEAMTISREENARQKGYTRTVYIEGGMEDGDFLIQPDAGLDDRFRAYALDWGGWVWVNGWNCLVEDTAS